MSQVQWKSCLAVVTLASVVVLAGCSFQMGYNRPYVEYSASKLPILFKGKALIVTTPEADSAVTSQAPSSFVGGAIQNRFDSGVFVRDTALLVFSRAFVLGGEHRSSLPEQPASMGSAIIEPRLASFDFKNTADGVIGQSTKRTARAVVSVRFHLGDGTVVERQYDSGYVAFEANSGFGGESADQDSYSGRIKRLTALTELNFAHAFVVAYQYALKDMESFMPKEALIRDN
jgi:hypothetical protein